MIAASKMMHILNVVAYSKLPPVKTISLSPPPPQRSMRVLFSIPLPTLSFVNLNLCPSSRRKKWYLGDSKVFDWNKPFMFSKTPSFWYSYLHEKFLYWEHNLWFSCVSETFSWTLVWWKCWNMLSPLFLVLLPWLPHYKYF